MKKIYKVVNEDIEIGMQTAKITEFHPENSMCMPLLWID